MASRLLRIPFSLQRILRCRGRLSAFSAGCSTTAESNAVSDSDVSFDTRILDYLACPLSKKPLRYDPVMEELICDGLGVAYPIQDGIPVLIPESGRLIRQTNPDKQTTPER